MYIFGYIIPTALILGLLMYFFGSRSWSRITIYMILVPLIIFFVFSRWLNIIVPESFLERILFRS